MTYFPVGRNLTCSRDEPELHCGYVGYSEVRLSLWSANTCRRRGNGRKRKEGRWDFGSWLITSTMAIRRLLVERGLGHRHERKVVGWYLYLMEVRYVDGETRIQQKTLIQDFLFLFTMILGSDLDKNQKYYLRRNADCWWNLYLAELLLATINSIKLSSIKGVRLKRWKVRKQEVSIDNFVLFL